MKEKLKKIIEQAYDSGWEDCDYGNKYGDTLKKYQQIVEKVLANELRKNP